ncbi:alpha/beta fold hydrolase [Euzebya tangerina]|uniref:alpha/beta fold hydrolase n=1 Tax=Euzebya tangerina TaxID=591198 RepID=UPI000E323958|nr:alpha/beta hydrolase [Euzebya tangerina]
MSDAPDRIEDPVTSTIATPTLELAYHDHNSGGTSSRLPVLLVHGFPDAPSSWLPITNRLVARGHRVLPPHLRGFGSTRFLDDSTPRSGQLAALTQDVIDLLDACDIDRAVLVGQDWGARAVQGVAATQPDRVHHLVSLGGYALSWGQHGDPPSYRQIQALWYQFFLSTGWGEGTLHADPLGFSRHLWTIWSPTLDDVDEAFERAAWALGGPDFARIVLSAYTERERDERYHRLESALGNGEPITVPSSILYGADDGIEPDGPDREHDRRMFTDLRAQRTIDGVGHFLHAERPEAVVDTIAAVVTDD